MTHPTWRIETGDCLNLLRAMPDKSIQTTITDPPFEEEAHTQGRRMLGLSSPNGCEVVSCPLPFAAISESTRIEVSRQIVRVCSGWVLAFCQAEAVGEWKRTLEDAGAKYRRSMVWIKPDGMPQYSGDRPGMGYESIVAAWCGEGKSTWNGGGRHGVFSFNKREGSGPNDHPTQKPYRLMLELVKLFTVPGSTVLDPFCGSGTTGVACVQTGRNFIGMELEPSYAAIARRRCAEAEPVLFKPREPEPILIDVREKS